MPTKEAHKRSGAHPDPPARRRERRRRGFAVPAFFVALLAAAAVVVTLVVRNGPSRPSAATTGTITDSVSTVAPTTPIPQPTAGVATLLPTTMPLTAAATAGDDDTVLTAAEVERFVRDYYFAVAAGDYQSSWSALAPEFQSGMAVSYDYYVDFWNENDIEVGGVQVVEISQDRIVVNVELRWNDDESAVVNQFTMRPDIDGDLLIAAQQTLAGD